MWKTMSCFNLEFLVDWPTSVTLPSLAMCNNRSVTTDHSTSLSCNSLTELLLNQGIELQTRQMN